MISLVVVGVFDSANSETYFWKILKYPKMVIIYYYIGEFHFV